MHAQITVIRRAVQTQVDAERHTGPRRVLGSAIEADFVGFAALQFVEDPVRFGLGRERHDGRMILSGDWLVGWLGEIRLALIEDW